MNLFKELDKLARPITAPIHRVYKQVLVRPVRRVANLPRHWGGIIHRNVGNPAKWVKSAVNTAGSSIGKGINSLFKEGFAGLFKGGFMKTVTRLGIILVAVFVIVKLLLAYLSKPRTRESHSSSSSAHQVPEVQQSQ